IQKKTETYFFTKIRNITDIYNIKNLLNNDNDLKNYISINQISIYNLSIPIKNINLSKIDNNTQFIKYKKGIGIIIEYEILKTKQNKRLLVYFPYIANYSEPISTSSDNSGSGGSGGGTNQIGSIRGGF
ncbi:MAG: hypothetical protein ACP5O4_06695, partial [bacterium]